MKWNEYNAAVSTSTESVRTDSLVRRNPETPAAENKKPNRTRNNKITVYLSDAELARLNAMVDIISDEFTDLTAKKEEPKMKPKPVRSTAGKER